jgi:two-component system LytT family response regulator
MKIRTLIVDDELLARNLIRKLLEAESGFEIVGECADGLEAVSAIQKLQPDLMFLDVQMPELGGFEVLKRIDSAQMPVVVFVTAYDTFALKAFEAHALDYLLKPLEQERFSQTLARVNVYLKGRQGGMVQERLLHLLNEIVPQPKTISRLAMKSGGRVVFLKVGEIDSIVAAGNYLEVRAGRECHLLRGRLSELERQLRPEQFFRIHRSTIVNLDRVKEFHPLLKGEGVVVMRDGSRFSASRSYSQKLQEFFETQL